MRQIGHFINGARVDGASGRTANVFNPATGQVQAEVALASDAELQAAVDSAKAAQPAWAATNPQRRARVFAKFVDLLNQGITPFNFPGMIPMWMFAPAIACGNAFILKPSERDPSLPIRLAELMMDAGLPAGVLNVVNGDKQAVDGILQNDDIGAVSFVGSTPIAQYVYSQGSANNKRMQCFGGAKNHMIIMPDADLDQAADALIGAGYGSAGERCMAISVAVPVGEDTANALIEKLVPKVNALKIGPWSGRGLDLGPVVTAEAKERILGLIQNGEDAGAELVVDNRHVTIDGYEDGFFITRKRSTCRCPTPSATVSRSSPVTVTPHATSPTEST